MKSGTIGRKSKPAEGKKKQKWGSRDAIHLVHRDAIASAVFLFFVSCSSPTPKMLASAHLLPAREEDPLSQLPVNFYSRNLPQPPICRSVCSPPTLPATKGGGVLQESPFIFFGCICIQHLFYFFFPFLLLRTPSSGCPLHPILPRRHLELDNARRDASS